MKNFKFKSTIGCRVLFIILLIILLVGQLAAQDQETPITSATSQLAKDLIGAWILAGIPGNVNEEPQVAGGRLKFIAGGHWAITQADPNGEIIYHQGGTYTLNGDEYIEKVEYANENTASLINTTLRFKIKVEGDTCTQVGIGNPYKEVWKRLNRPLTVDNDEEDNPSLSVAVTSVDMADIIKSAKTWKPAFTEWHGKPAPDFSIKDINGKTHKISSYRGKNLIINIWAAWCPPCRREIPDIIELRKTISEEELAILGISTERGEIDLVKQFVAKEKMNYTILIDEGTFVPPYSQITAIPTTFFIDAEGNIKIATIGVLTLEDMKNILKAK